MVKIYLFEYKNSNNLGDEIQTIAVENLLKNRKIDFIDRSELHNLTEKCIVIFQGWFRSDVVRFPLNENIVPIFFGFHISDFDYDNNSFLKKETLNYFKKFEPIGCRDKKTKNILTKHNIKSFYSGCLTTTFKKRKELKSQNKIFLVDVDRFIPVNQKIKKDGIYIHHVLGTEFSSKMKFMLANELLDKYNKEAKLVITSKLHCALPCIAMGIPVIFFGDKNDSRLGPIKDYLNIDHYINFSRTIRGTFQISLKKSFPFLYMNYFQKENFLWIFVAIIYKIFIHISYLFKKQYSTGKTINIEKEKEQRKSLFIEILDKKIKELNLI